MKLTLVSHISRESGISKSVPYQIDVVKCYGVSYGFFHLFDIDFSLYQQIMILEDGTFI